MGGQDHATDGRGLNPAVSRWHERCWGSNRRSGIGEVVGDAPRSTGMRDERGKSSNDGQVSVVVGAANGMQK